MPDIVIDVAGEVAGSPGVAREFSFDKISSSPPLVTLSIDDNTGITQWYWEILDQPDGATATLSSQTTSVVTFTPTARIPGTYLIRCTFNGGVSYARNATAWRTQFKGIRIPAAGEETEFGADKGWALALRQAILSMEAETPKVPCRALADSDQTLSGLPSNIDDVVSWSADDRILLNNQSDATENGIWETQTGAWTRPSDFDTGSSAAGALVWINEGTTYGDTSWACATNAPNDIIDTNFLTFVQTSGLGQVTAGTGLTKDGNVLRIGDGSTGNINGLNRTADNLAVAVDGTTIELASHQIAIKDLGKMNLTPATNLTKSSTSPWASVQVDDASTAIGDLMYVASDGNWERANASVKTTAMGIGIALEAGSGSKNMMLRGGIFKNDAWSWTPGLVLYASTTSGQMSHTPPSVTGQYIVPVAIPLTATVIMLIQIFHEKHS